MMTYDHDEDRVEFLDWHECPSYLKTTLSKALADEWQIIPNKKMRVICTNDIEISYSEAQLIKETLKETYDFREFRLEENHTDRKDALENGEIEENDVALSIDEIVINSLSEIKELKSIDNKKLIELYKKL